MNPAEVVFVNTFVQKERRGLRCKDYFQARKFFECILLSGYPEQRGDEHRLTLCIATG